MVIIGIDASMAKDGKFGRGIYLTDESAKVNQYAGIGLDAEDRSNCPNNVLSKLHKKLYSPHLVEHPGDVYYAFVCRVALGDNIAVDKKEDIPFANGSRSSLKDGTYQSVLVKRTRTIGG